MSSTEFSPAQEEMKLLQAKRAYNRESASRARKRRKIIISELEKKIEDLIEDKAVLRRSLKVMENQIHMLQKLTEIRTKNAGDALAGTGYRNGEEVRKNDYVLPQVSPTYSSLYQQPGWLTHQKLPVLPLSDLSELYRFHDKY